MTKCVYCPCTVAIPPGKSYCDNCGHDAVAHVASNPTAAGRQGSLVVVAIIAIAIVAVYFSSLGTRERANSQPISQGVQPPAPPLVVNESSNVPVATSPRSEQSDRPYTPPAPPLGPWKSGR